MISCDEYNAHTESVFKFLDLLKVRDTFKFEAPKFYYKYSQKNITTLYEMFTKILIETIMKWDNDKFKFFINIKLESMQDGNI